ncbi:hypothetical protein, partial [Methylobacter sp.]|uniref:hypothetical protein n=1 Tax=Methylobacter sp. TaxID=2051955 RepID=UPI0024870A2B
IALANNCHYPLRIIGRALPFLKIACRQSRSLSVNSIRTTRATYFYRPYFKRRTVYNKSIYCEALN